MQNIELKAAYPDLARGAKLAEAFGAEHRGVLRQTDTYFQTRFGRLKLRERPGAPTAELIAYHREDRPDARTSEYEIIPVADPAAAKRGLARTLGIRVIVVKQRDLWVWRNVRIHLDRVEDLGGFIEFEAVLERPDQADEGRRSVGELARHFGVAAGEVEHVSYAELLLARSGRTITPHAGSLETR